MPLSAESGRRFTTLDDLWQLAPTAANGAALLALLNLVGNVADPDAAIASLRWVFLLTGLGLLCGLMSLLSARRQREHEARLWTVMKGLEETLTELSSLDVSNVAAETPQRREVVRRTLDFTATRMAKLNGRIDLHFDGAFRDARLAELTRQASVLFLCAAFCTAWAGNLMGRQLQPEPAPIEVSAIREFGHRACLMS